MALKSSKTFSSTAQTAASSQAFMPPHLLPHRDHFWPFGLLDLLLNYPSIILVLQNPHLASALSTPQAVIPLSRPPLHLPSSHLFWDTDPARPHPLCTATLCSRPSPAARLLIGIGGGERIAVRHGRPLEPTKPGQGHSHHSRVTAAHSKQWGRESEGCWS